MWNVVISRICHDKGTWVAFAVLILFALAWWIESPLLGIVAAVATVGLLFWEGNKENKSTLSKGLLYTAAVLLIYEIYLFTMIVYSSASAVA